MHFKIVYTSTEGTAVNIPSSEIGLDGLYQIRTHLEEHVDAKRVSPCVSELCSDVTAYITEDMARASRMFSHSTKVSVNVMDGALNRFVRDVVKTVKSDDGKILHAYIAPEIDEYAVAEAWVKARAPTHWCV